MSKVLFPDFFVFQLLSGGSENGCIFFSVERFDYTKGIMEKLRVCILSQIKILKLQFLRGLFCLWLCFQAWKRYFELHPDRIGLDVLFQVAVTNRRSVESYRVYQDSCLKLVNEVNENIRSKEYPNWRAIKFDTEGLPDFLTLLLITSGYRCRKL